MQTFLPYPSFRESVRTLDPSRLGNQIWREGMTLIRGGWPHHLASKMWRGYEQALALYLLNGVKELEARGGSYWDRPWCVELVRLIDRPIADIVLPPWLGDERVHASHRACLLRKGLMDVTFDNLRGTHGFPDRKGKWTEDHYQDAWRRFGVPESTWYTQFDWQEEPDLRPLSGPWPYYWPVREVA